MSTTLNADVREKVGTRSARALRAAGRIPASLQSNGEQPHVNLSIDETEFLTSRRKHEHLYDLKFGAATESAIVRELAWDVFGESIEHIEFRRVDLTKKTDVNVTLDWYGTPKGGTLVHEMSQVMISTTPANIPDSILVKVGEMEAGDVLKIGDVVLPEGVELAPGVDSEAPVARVAVPKAEAEETAEGDAEAGEVPVVGDESKPTEGEG